MNLSLARDRLAVAAAIDPDQRTVKGLGWALQRKIQQGIEIRRMSKGARHMHRAAALLDVAKKNLARSDAGLTRISDAGDFRRGSLYYPDTVLSSFDFVIASV